MTPTDEPFKLREIWPPGTLIRGDYVIERRLGGGGFGTVYLARHRFLGTLNVIKRLHEHFASDAEYVRKFVNEARAIRRLKACPNIVEVEHMTQSEDGHLILVMEHVAGGDLAALMETRALSVAEVIEYGCQIAVALQAAHEAGLIHRDIKPQNVMISQDSTGKPLLKLIDFGIAADHAIQQVTSVMRGGSIGFAAPEQWVRAGKQLDGRADLYALGATMYRMLTGRMPYPTAYDIGDWIEKVKQGPPEPPRQLREDVPAELSGLIMEMLALRPESRPSGADVVVSRLRAMQTRKEAPRPVSSPEPERVVAPAMPPPIPQQKRSGVWKTVGIVVACLLGVVLVLAGLFASLVSPRLREQVDLTRRIATKARIQTFQTALVQFKLDTGVYPSTEAGLNALYDKPSNLRGWSGPYIQQDNTNDLWNQPFVYRYPGQHGDEPDIISYGADGQPGGEGAAADIVSWDLR